MESVFGIVAGVFGIVVGMVLFIKRKAFTKFSADSQRATFGKAGDKVADRANSGYTGVVGIGFMLIGAVLVVLMLTGVKM